jgi:hypothetical protein
MKCKKAKKLISYQIDGQIKANDLSELKNHLLLCPHCNKEYKELFDYKNLFKETFDDVTPPALSSRFDRVFYRRLEEQTILQKTNILEKFILPYKRIWAKAGILVTAAVLIVTLIIPKNKPMETPLKMAESNLSTLIESAVAKSNETEVKNFVDLQAKEILQNFL